ncbi:hypothetical protein AGOR_G00087130 [Albula goreensis]|uniref:Uncharacterized protein n=1 Tax=Albula goreensis TaxID=1534307 RepID=A0A8T3DKQ0_9TELE|nr:hypothetical protein AGOR_G00087130 [Albula goreensis]
MLHYCNYDPGSFSKASTPPCRPQKCTAEDDTNKLFRRCEKTQACDGSRKEKKLYFYRLTQLKLMKGGVAERGRHKRKLDCLGNTSGIYGTVRERETERAFQ